MWKASLTGLYLHFEMCIKPTTACCYTTLTAAFADSAMTPRLILRHRGQTPRLPSRESLGHARLALLIYPIKRRVARRSYQINPA